jgi:mRNA interferase RelE/StbE
MNEVNTQSYMNSSPKWQLVVAKPAEKSLSKVPAKDRARILSALRAMCENPFGGDVARLQAQPAAWRRRIGSYRILYDIHPEILQIVVTAIVRRTTATY